ncbi:MAG: 50S ribosomal protein L5 [Patescibacteria group bacterium]|jgi:large subunit ribosomal protein L5
MERLSEQYTNRIKLELKKELGYKNDFESPQIEKIVVSSGIGDFKEDKKIVEQISTELTRITGQKVKLNLSKKAVSAFKLRIGQPIGLTVTLRGTRMYDFINRLVNVALPRVRDFRGLSNTSFDEKGNYSIGLRDYSIFPEIKFEEATVNFGLEINIKIRSKSKEDSKQLLVRLGFPFKKEGK